MRKKDQVREEILRRLLTARYRFGDAIPVKELVEETGISRQPIMTALGALAADGFVNIVAQVGCEVASPSFEEIDDFYLMFGRLEGLMAELAARRRTEDELKAMISINRRIEAIDAEDPSAPEQYRLLNRHFHSLIHQMAKSPLLFERQGNIFSMSDFFIAQTGGFVPHLRAAAEEHDRMIFAISAGDPQAASAASEAHIREVGEYVRSSLAEGRPLAVA